MLVDLYGNIGIYKSHDDFDWVSYCSLGHNGGFQHFKIEHDNEKTYPATKEQCNLLFSKMKEAGYTFDFEKKELKKIEEELTDFEKSLKHIMIETLECGDTRNLKADAEMLLRIAQKPKEWSEKDERICQCLIESQEKFLDMINNNKYNHSEIISDLKEMYGERIDWLESLKDRYTWKPSKEQMKALHDMNLTGNISCAGQGQTLIELYNDLRRLTK